MQIKILRKTKFRYKIRCKICRKKPAGRKAFASARRAFPIALMSFSLADGQPAGESALAKMIQYTIKGGVFNEKGKDESGIFADRRFIAFAIVPRFYRKQPARGKVSGRVAQKQNAGRTNSYQTFHNPPAGK